MTNDHGRFPDLPFSQLSVEVHPDLSSIGEAEWNALAGTSNPFIQYGFLRALETNQCVGPELGWHPCHLSLRDEHNTLVAAMPMYVKTHYYGEFVFDWSWDQAYQRAGLDYYPKLVVSIPYTPATGPRMLLDRSKPHADTLRQILVQQAQQVAEKNQLSSIHWLFTDEADTDWFRRNGFALRMGCNYHWHNNHYQDFDQFLDAFSSKKRKNVRRERRLVEEQGITLQRYQGSEISNLLMDTFSQFYQDTFDKKSGWATLNPAFFRDIRDRLGDQVALAIASKGDDPVAGALFFRGDQTLFGRYWGCKQDFDSLHFETCYYQGLELAIEHGLAQCDPGVQGEHKISRGFLPTATWSAHWIANPRFASSIYRYCEQEQSAVEQQRCQLWSLSPYRDDAVPPTQPAPPQRNKKAPL